MQLNISVLLVLLVVVSACNDPARSVAPPVVAAAPSGAARTATPAPAPYRLTPEEERMSELWAECSVQKSNELDTPRNNPSYIAYGSAMACRQYWQGTPGKDVEIILEVVNTKRAIPATLPPSRPSRGSASAAPPPMIPSQQTTRASVPEEPWMDCTRREYQKRDVLKGSIAAHAEAITLPCRSLNPYGPGEDTTVIVLVIQRRRAEIGG